MQFEKLVSERLDKYRIMDALITFRIRNEVSAIPTSLKQQVAGIGFSKRRQRQQTLQDIA